jgi:serine protease Do
MAILEAPGGLGELSGAAAALLARVRPSVVSVRVAAHGAGAGVVWRPDGLIVTNAHVASRERAEVVFDDGRTLPARLVAREPANDLAALCVEARDLPAVTVADSDALRVGQLVFALGHPLGEPYSAAVGIVRAVDQPQPDGAAARRVVQADLTLFPGNSGGPLLDAHGAVVGINSMVMPPRLALAVPSAEVVRFLGLGGRARLGVRLQAVGLPPPLVARLGLRGDGGAMIVEVLPDEPAAAAGLLPGDILVAVGGERLERPAALAGLLAQAAPGAVRFTVVRGGRLQEFDIVPRSAW